MILVTELEHGKTLLGLLPNFKVAWINGSSKAKERSPENVVKYDIVIASNVFNTGVDFPWIDTLIFACGGKSSIGLVQRAGRVLRLFPGKRVAKIHDFWDDAEHLRQHGARRRELYEAMGFLIETRQARVC